jgi:P27 family predicted phage terminase small subunit
MSPTWSLVSSELARRTTTAATDVLLIEAVVRQIHRLRDIGAVLDSRGVVEESSRGERRPSPFLKAERDAAITLLRLSEPLGLTVGARLRLGLQQLSGVSLMDELMRSIEEDD